MKKLLLNLVAPLLGAAFVFAVFVVLDRPTQAAPFPRVVGEMTTASINPLILIEPLSFSMTTTTQGNNRRTATVTTSDGTDAVPTVVTDGIDLEGIEYVQVFLTTSATATAGGKLDGYRWNSFTKAWARDPAWDLTTIANTKQSWAPVNVGVRQGRAAWTPNGVGTLTTTIHLVSQPK